MYLNCKKKKTAVHLWVGQQHFCVSGGRLRDYKRQSIPYRDINAVQRVDDSRLDVLAEPDWQFSFKFSGPAEREELHSILVKLTSQDYTSSRALSGENAEALHRSGYDSSPLPFLRFTHRML